MKNQLNPTQSISNLTLSDLEKLIETIVKRTIQQEGLSTQGNLEQSFRETFGAWQDEKTAREIIQEIYDSRNPKIEQE